MKLFVLNSKLTDPNGYIFQALTRALKRRSDVQLKVISIDDMKQIPRDPQNQALLVYGGEELHQIPQEQIDKPFGRRAIWFTEDPYEAKRNQVSAKHFQIVFTNDSGSLSLYKKAHHLPLAADPELIPRRIRHGIEKLLFFSGTAWPNRKKLLNKLLSQWSNAETFDLHMVANQFVENQLGQKDLHEKIQFEETIAISEFMLRASNSLCTLVVGRDFSGSGKHNYARSPGPRLFEAGITGSCQIVHAAEIPDMPKGMEEGRHYLRFNTTEQLVSLLRQAEIDPSPFRAIGEAMASEIKARHTYDQRAAVLVESLLHYSPEVKTTAELTPTFRVLFVSHEQTKPGFQYGGAGICLDQIIAAAPKDVDVRVLCRSGDDGHRFTLLDRHGKRIGGFRCRQKVNEFSLHHPELESEIDRLLKEWQPQIVHVNHLLGFSPAILSVARNNGARTLVTLHDYYAICDNWNLLNDQNKFCGINEFYDKRCQDCCSRRHPQFRFVDPLRRRVVMAEAIAQVHGVIVPSLAAEQQLRAVHPHLPKTQVIKPDINQSMGILEAGKGNSLIILIPGNLAINKGYLDLRSIIEQSNDFGLDIRFRVLGRVEPWIEQELALITNVELMGRYDNHSFSSKAAGADLALFLSPWPETYCITFDEWKCSGRPCIYYAIGALAEPHRQQGLHQASEGFDVGDLDGIMRALIQTSTPEGLQRLRKPNQSKQASTEGISFGNQHWSLFQKMMNYPLKPHPIHYVQNAHQTWAHEHVKTPIPTARQRLVSLIYRLPGGHKIAALWRRVRRR